MENPSLRKPIYRKGFALKQIGAADLRAALASENVYGESDTRFGIRTREDGTRELHHADDNGYESVYTLEQGMYWLFTWNKEGEIVDWAQFYDSPEGEASMLLRVDFFNMLGIECEVWYCGKDGIRKEFEDTE